MLLSLLIFSCCLTWTLLSGLAAAPVALCSCLVSGCPPLLHFHSIWAQTSSMKSSSSLPATSWLNMNVLIQVWWQTGKPRMLRNRWGLMLSCSVDKEKVPRQQPVLEGSIVDKCIYFVNICNCCMLLVCLLNWFVSKWVLTDKQELLLLLHGHVSSDTRNHPVNAVAATLVCTPESDGASCQRLLCFVWWRVT